MGSNNNNSDKVDFTVRNVYDLNSKIPIVVTGQYRKLNPKYKSNATQEDIDAFRKDLADWFITNTHREWRKVFYDQLWGAVYTSARAAIHCMPYKSPDSKEIFFVGKWMIWSWLYDEPVEMRYQESPLSSDELMGMREVHTHLIDIMEAGGMPKQPRPITSTIWNPQELDSLFNLMEDIAKTGVDLLGLETFSREVKSVIRATRFGFDGNEWGFTSKFEKNYSLQPLKTFRGYNLLGLWMLNLMAFASRKYLHNEEIRNHVMFAEIEKIIQISLYMANDLLGLGKDFSGGNEKIASEVYYRVSRVGMDLQSAVTATCNDFDQILLEYGHLKDGLLLIFGKDEELLEFFDVVDACLWGQHWVYDGNARYKFGKGKIEINFQ